MILEVIGFAALGHLMVDFIQELGLKELDRKPFNCNMCFTYWLSFIPFIHNYGLKGLLLSAIAGLTSELIYRILNRL